MANMCQSLCCTDWSQPVENVGCTAGLGLGIAGAVTGNPAFVVAGFVTGAASTVFASIRTACLGDTIHLGRSAASLSRSVASLTHDDQAEAAAIEELKAAKTQIADDLRSLIEQKNKIKIERDANAAKINTLTGDIERLTENVTHARQELAEAKAKLESQLKEHTGAHAAAAAAVTTADTDSAATTARLSKEVDSLRASAASASKDNDRLQKLVDSLKADIASRQDQIEQLKTEKSALQKLTEAEDEERDLEKRIDENSLKLQEISAKLQRFADQLRAIITDPQEIDSRILELLRTNLI